MTANDPNVEAALRLAVDPNTWQGLPPRRRSKEGVGPMPGMDEVYDTDRPVVCSECGADLLWIERQECFVAQGGLYDGADVCPDQNGTYWAHSPAQN